ncbi:MAG: DUF4411 family protein [Planctomycetes bacterium]|jgi:hypothetical protein|nr:DUF4411 family protein [Planctomycetota bacterium]
MAYLLDADTLIRAKNLHYGFDFCPAFWEWLVQQNHIGEVFSIEHVGDELAAGDDQLSEWAARRGDGFFLPPDTNALPALGTVADWVNQHERYTAAAKNTFLQVADYYLVSQALAGGHIVVTHERPENSIHRVKIPNVCLGVDVRCVNPFDMLRRKRARFVLSGPTTGTLWDATPEGNENV